MSRLLLLANPSASGFRGSTLRQVVYELSGHFDVEQIWPDDADATRAAASQAAAGGIDVVAAMGGDGVVHHAANGLAGSESALAIIPVGTTNVFARILGVPRRAARAAATLHELAPRAVRMGRVTYGGPGPGARLATFSIGSGFDGAVIERAEQRPYAKQRFGSAHYARTALSELMRYRGSQSIMTATCGDATSEAVAVSVQLQDGYTYLGPIPLRFGDGHGLTALVARRLRPARSLGLLARMATARVENAADDFEIWKRVEELTVTAPEPVPLQADGEPLGRVTAFTVTPAKEQLKVMAPTSRQPTADS